MIALQEDMIFFFRNIRATVDSKWLQRCAMCSFWNFGQRAQLLKMVITFLFFNLYTLCLFIWHICFRCNKAKTFRIQIVLWTCRYGYRLFNQCSFSNWELDSYVTMTAMNGKRVIEPCLYCQKISNHTFNNVTYILNRKLQILNELSPLTI